MKVNNWVDELRNQLKNFDAETLDCEIKIEYRAKGFEKNLALNRP